MGNELVIALTAVIGALFLVSNQARADRLPSGSAGDQIVRNIVDEQIHDILNRLGHYTKTLDESAILITIRDQSVVLVKYDSSLQLYASFEGGVELQRINRWNAETRYANAYLDSDGDAAMELDLDLAGGVTVARLEDYFTTYETLLVNFIIEVLSIDEDDNNGDGGICEPVDAIEGNLVPA